MEEPGTLVHPRFQLVGCTPDRVIRGTLELSVKARSAFVAEQYGEEGTDEVPNYELLQLQYSMITTKELYGISHGEIAVDLGELRTFVILPNPELQEAMIEAVERFHQDYVVSKKPPELEPSNSDAAWLQATFKKYQPSLRQLGDDEPLVWAKTYFRAREEEKKYKNLKEAAKLNLEAYIGDMEGAENEQYRFLWRDRKVPAKVQWPLVISDIQNTYGMKEEELRTIVEARTERKTTRGFRATEKGKSNGDDE
jgi:predicted phage-related endonuclease